MQFPPTAKKLLLTSIVVALGYSTAAIAQDTASAIRGKLLDASGQPLTDATVVVRDTRTGATRTLQSNASGTFYATNLPVGGPYNVTVNGTKTVTVNSISLGDIYNLSIEMGESQIQEIIVLGGSNTFVDVAAGPSASFSTFDMETSVAYDRDIKDVYSIDPRMNLDGGEQVNCVGKHPRFNSISLDGISQNDRFGLNSNGYSTATGMPFPYEGIAQVSAELAPFDVTYGGFTACNINAVTKSGSNEWTGTVFLERTGDQWRGDTLKVNGETQDYSSKDFTEDTKGFSIGGPLLEDKLFIYGAYEESEQPRFLAMGYAGSSNGVERPWLSKEDHDRIESISNDVYNYKTGGQPSDGAQTDEKYMLRLDWNINEQHDATAIYNYYDGVQLRSSDGDSNEFEFANHFYNKGAESETTTLRLRSQWSDALSSEVFYSKNTMKDAQVTVGPADFADMQISIGRDTVYLGADDSRQANALNTKSEFFKASGEYLLGDQILTFGYERETLNVFNQFVQHSNGGEYDFFDDSGSNSTACQMLTAQGRFDDASCNLSGIDKFELGRPSRIYYGSGGGTNDATDAAASFENTLNTVYLQDELYLPNYNLTVVAGLRYDWFESDDRPSYNAKFSELTGIRNDKNINGVDLLMPRIGFTWEADYNLTIRGGAGLYSGGNPNVWISNAWSNDGLTNVQRQLRNFNSSISVLNDTPLSGSGRPGYDVPQTLIDQVAATTADNASDRFLVVIDPNYDQPSEWKLALGGTYTFDSGLSLDADFLYSIAQDSAYYLDVSQEQVGTTTSGQPIYDFAKGQNNFMLTNSDREAKSTSFSLVARHDYDFGLDWMVGYAFTDAEDISPMTSSTAGSNFDNLATSTIVNPESGISNYNTPHRITARLSYGKEFLNGYESRITAMFYRKQGQGQSHVMGSADQEGNGRFGRHLLYVPGPNDGNVVVGPNFDVGAFRSFIEREGYGQGFVDRNENNGAWSSRIDLRIDQEIPTFLGASNGRVYLKIYNLMNMLDDSKGIQYDAQFFSQQVVDSNINDAGQYVFNTFTDRSLTDLLENRSLWEMRLGIQFEF